MTKRIYVNEPYQQSFDAVVEKIKGNDVWLDRTCFYPESGGQVSDTGVLNGQGVANTQFDQEKNIFHVLDSTPTFRIGDKVSCQIDWERRYKIMRVHAASHIMEHFLFEIFGHLKLVGSHLNEKYDKSTYDSEVVLDSNKLTEVEKLANEFIGKHITIETWASDHKRPHFRSWKCGEIEMSCGGTHPKNTKEIGPIKIKRETGGQGREKVITSLVS